jgi:hypothetical protein
MRACLSDIDLAALAEEDERAFTSGLQLGDALLIAFRFVAEDTGLDLHSHQQESNED